MNRLVTQPTGTPTRKVAYGATGAALSGIPAAVVVSMLARWFRLDMQPEEAVVVGSLIGSLIAGAVSFVVGYLTRNRATDIPSGTA